MPILFPLLSYPSRDGVGGRLGYNRMKERCSSFRTDPTLHEGEVKGV